MFAKNMCDDTFIMTFHQLPGEKKRVSQSPQKTSPSRLSLHIRTYSISGQIPGNMNNLVRDPYLQ